MLYVVTSLSTIKFACDYSSLEMPAVPTLTLMLAVNKSFVVTNPIFQLYGKEVCTIIVFINLRK